VEHRPFTEDTPQVRVTENDSASLTTYNFESQPEDR